MKQPKKPAVMKDKRTFENYQALGSHFIAQDIAITCLLDALAKSQPANAGVILQSLKEGIKNIPKGQYEQATEKVELWIAMMEQQIAKNPQ